MIQGSAIGLSLKAATLPPPRRDEVVQFLSNYRHCSRLAEIRSANRWRYQLKLVHVEIHDEFDRPLMDFSDSHVRRNCCRYRRPTELLFNPNNWKNGFQVKLGLWRRRTVELEEGAIRENLHKK